MSAEKSYRSEQEKFWAGDFGDQYVARSADHSFVPARIYMFSEILKHTRSVESFLEFGPNVGLNLLALRQLCPRALLSGVEINATAVQKLRQNGFENVVHGSFLDSTFDKMADFSFTSGVLIHINPDLLSKAYEALYATSRKYICVNEYYNPVPVELEYRGNKGKLYKRDFAGELLDKYPDLKLVSYGFIYSRDPNFSQDDSNWFLLEKS